MLEGPNILRDFGDEVLMQSVVGRELVRVYYRVSPPVADFISEHEAARTLVRKTAVRPTVAVLDTTQDLWND